MPGSIRTAAHGARVAVVVCPPGRIEPGTVSLYGEWFVAWHALGHPPRPSLDDPKTIVEIRSLHVAIGLLIKGFLPAAVLALVLNLLVAIRRRRRLFQLGVRIAMVLLVWPLFLNVLLWWDPNRALEWWLD